MDHWTHKWRVAKTEYGVNSFRCTRCGCISTSMIASAVCDKNEFGKKVSVFMKNWRMVILTAGPMLVGGLIGVCVIVLLKVLGLIT